MTEENASVDQMNMLMMVLKKEENSYNFYIRASKLAQLSNVSDLFLELAGEELKHKEKVLGFYKTFRNTKNIFEYIKSIIKFPEYFPPVRDILLDQEKMYVVTYNHRGTEVEFLVFDLNGKFLEKIFIDIKGEAPLIYTIFNGETYQLIENAEEEWEMHITTVKKK